MVTESEVSPRRRTSLDSPPLALELSAVSKSYGRVRAVRSLDLSVESGQTLALLGPNGAGKSTLIGMMVGLIAPDSGHVEVMGASPAAAVASGRIAAMLQDVGLMPGVRVGELVRLGASLYPNPFPVAQALSLAGVEEIGAHRVDRLSGGQAQRVRFALAVVGRPDMLVLDEPTRALDVEGRAEFWRAIRSYADTGRTVLFATHYLEEVEDNADRVVVMAGGAIVADGTPHEVRSHAGLSRVRFRIDDSSLVGRNSRDRRHARDGGDSDESDKDDRDSGAESLLAEAGLLESRLVTTSTVRGGRVTLSTAAPDDVVRQLTASGVPWHSLEVSPPDLDQSYLELTRVAAVAAQEERS